MRCAKARELLSEYVDGLVSPRVHEELSEHFAACSSCARELETTTQMLAAVSDLRVAKAPVDLWPAVQARVESRPAPEGMLKRLLIPVLRPLVAVPAAAAVGGALMLMMAQTHHTPPAPQHYARPEASSEMAAYVEEYSEFRSKQSFGDTSGLIAAHVDKPTSKGE